MSSQILFFATRNDLLPILETVENESEIKYVKCGSFDKPISVSFANAALIPDLGIASCESSINSTTFLLCGRTEEIHPRQVATARYLFDQLLNPKTIAFTPGGYWSENILLNGRFATASTHAASLALLKRFQSVVRKRFEKIKAYWVGEEAAQLLDSGKRLTIAAQSARMFDLK